jgi:hypothetical protein
MNAGGYLNVKVEFISSGEWGGDEFFGRWLALIKNPDWWA